MRTNTALQNARADGIRIVAPLIVVFLVALSASAALAQETDLGGKLRSGDQVLVSASETVDGDLYATGGLVRVDGTVDGDLLASAGQVQVTGEVTGDVMAAGGTIDVSGQVAGDVRAAGGQLTVTGSVGEDLVAAGGQVTLASSGEVGQDLVFGAGRTTLDGTVTGDVLGSAGGYSRDGTVGGSENVTIRDPAERVPTVADRSLAALQRLVSILVVAGLALWLAPRLVEAPARTLRRRPLASLGVGVVGLVAAGLLALAVILVAALVAVGLGFLGLGDLLGAVLFAVVATLVLVGFLLFLALVFGAPTIMGMSLADLVMPSGSATRRWWPLAVGVLVVVVASALPVVGGWVAFLVAVFGLGALILAFRPAREPSDDGDDRRS